MQHRASHHRAALTGLLLLAGAATARAQRRPPVPGATASERVLAVLEGVQRNLRATRYQHTLSVNEAQGTYLWDCSLMASWVLSRAAPEALASLRSARPLAVDYWRAFVTPEATRGRGPWQRVQRVEDARPGDLLAWRRPPWFPSRNSGHVAVVVGAPQRWGEGWLVRVADASSYNHEDDTRQGGTGFGLGTMLLTVDPQTGAPTGYGWFGRAAANWVIPAELALARPLR